MPSHPQKGKLRNKIFLLMAAVGIVPLLVAGALTVYVVTNSHRDDVTKLESAVLVQKGIEIQNFLNDRLLSQTSIVVPYAPTGGVSVSAEAFLLKQSLGALPFLRSESILDLQGKELVRVDRTHLDGYPAASLRDMSASSSFVTAKAGQYYLSAVGYSSDAVPVVSFAAPVKSGIGEVIGVLVGEAALTNLQDIVATAKIGNSGYVYLVDDAGNVMAGGGNLANAIGSDVVASFPMVRRVVSGSDALTPEDQMRYQNSGGAPVVAAGLALTGYGHWGLIAEWPTSEADAVINSLLVKNSIELFIVLLAIVLLSIFFALFLTRPIRKLEAGTLRVSSGKFEEGVDIRTGDELEELGDSFNTMMMKLKELEQLKDEFVFIAAHELRTPVAAMKGYLTLILDGTTGAISDGTRAFIEKVIASNQRLIQLVNDLLEVARSQAGRLSIKVAPVALAPAVAGVLDELKSLADEKDVSLVYEAPSDLPNVLADTDRIKEVVVNLVGNAIKYMGGGGKVTVTHEKKDGEVVTHIADTGLGISKESQARLFEKFYRVQTDKTKEITGTGLGLFIVKEIVEKMNGKIWVESEEGKGSVFSFSLPLAG